jgi:poly-gamma-glutamate capsule biosynthesis protein CapA/YwtB (metallophosphatase superfamily)
VSAPPRPRIGLLGDVMLGRLVAQELARGVPAHELWAAEVREICRSLDVVIVNLECCLSERGEPTRLIPGKPFFFRGPPAAVDALAAIGADVASLANNHALDFGPQAAADTVATLERAGIAAVGAGSDRASAGQPVVVRAGSRSIGVVAFADHPQEYAARDPGWGIAHARLRTGAPTWIRERIAQLRARCDLVVAFPHWGPNMTTAPARWQRAVATQLQDAGADLVAGHSAHVFHGVGWGARGPILYDLGGALDDYAVDPDLRNDLGLLAIWEPGAPDELDVVGLRIERTRTRIVSGEDARWVGKRLGRACAQLGTDVEAAGEARWRVGPGRR